MKYFEACKIWNAKQTNAGNQWCIPKKGSKEYDEVIAIMKGTAPKSVEVPVKKEEPKKEKEEKDMTLEEKVEAGFAHHMELLSSDDLAKMLEVYETYDKLNSENSEIAVISTYEFPAFIKRVENVDKIDNTKDQRFIEDLAEYGIEVVKVPNSKKLFRLKNKEDAIKTLNKALEIMKKQAEQTKIKFKDINNIWTEVRKKFNVSASDLWRVKDIINRRIKNAAKKEEPKNEIIAPKKEEVKNEIIAPKKDDSDMKQRHDNIKVFQNRLNELMNKVKGPLNNAQLKQIEKDIRDTKRSIDENTGVRPYARLIPSLRRGKADKSEWFFYDGTKAKDANERRKPDEGFAYVYETKKQEPKNEEPKHEIIAPKKQEQKKEVTKPLTEKTKELNIIRDAIDKVATKYGVPTGHHGVKGIYAPITTQKGKTANPYYVFSVPDTLPYDILKDIKAAVDSIQDNVSYPIKIKLWKVPEEFYKDIPKKLKGGRCIE